MNEEHDWDGHERRGTIVKVERAQRWFEILWPAALVVGGFVMWQGGQKAEFEAMQVALARMNEIPVEIQKLQSTILSIEQKIDQDKRIAALELRNSLATFEQRVSGLEGKVDHISTTLINVWPRLRALDKNVTILERGLNRAGQSVELEEPQKF